MLKILMSTNDNVLKSLLKSPQKIEEWSLSTIDSFIATVNLKLSQQQTSEYVTKQSYLMAQEERLQGLQQSLSHVKGEIKTLSGRIEKIGVIGGVLLLEQEAYQEILQNVLPGSLVITQNEFSLKLKYLSSQMPEQISERFVLENEELFLTYQNQENVLQALNINQPIIEEIFQKNIQKLEEKLDKLNGFQEMLEEKRESLIQDYEKTEQYFIFASEKRDKFVAELKVLLPPEDLEIILELLKRRRMEMTTDHSHSPSMR